MGKLVAYSGFSSSNYLEQPYNSDLDFGTGDFCVMGWVKTSHTSLEYMAERQAGKLEIMLWQTGGIRFYVAGGSITTSALNSNTWRHVALFRNSGVIYAYVDGVLDVSGSANTNVDTTTSAPLTIGARNANTYNMTGSLALFRISATAPTADQIKKIYEDEKVLFQENAACTLYGASDAVTALAHDSDTGLLHVGTSAGRSVFQGLRRVSNTTTAVGTAISASNGLVVEE